MKWLIGNINDFSEAQIKNGYLNLSPSRKARIDRYKRQEDRRRSICGELLIKKILTDEYKIKNPVIECDEKGKPYVLGGKIHISISHSGDRVFCAADSKPIGVDIEEIKPINLKIAEKIATDEELEFIGEDINNFYEVWTAKEAYFKLKGGKTANFKTFSILNLNREVIERKEYFAQIVKEGEG